MTEVKATIVVLPRATALYPDLLTPKPFMKNGKPAGEPKYSITSLFDVSDPEVLTGLNTAKAAAVKACQDEWPDRDVVAAIRADEIQWPFKKGDIKAQKRESKGEKGDFYKGMEVLKAATTFAPDVIDKNRVQIIDPKKLYSGMVVRVEVNFKAGNANGDYVTAYLNFVLKVADGTRLAGRTAASAFEGIEEPDDVSDANINFDQGAVAL